MEERLTNSVVLGIMNVFPKDYTLSKEELIYQKLSKLEDAEEEFNIDLIDLLNANTIYIAMFSYWRWNLKDKQQCQKDDIGAIEEKRIEEKHNFYINFANKEIVIIEFELIDDDYETKITRLKFEDYGKSWAFTRKELE